MRLWHFKLIPFLPKSQLLAQWRELNSIFKKQDKHILINYVYEYDKSHLLSYTQLVLEEMHERGFKTKSPEQMFDYFGRIENLIYPIKNPFPKHHNDSYLRQCFYNLQEKYDRGQKDFSEQLYDKLWEFFKNEIH